MSSSSSFKILISLLAVKALLIVIWILYGGIGLGPDEAQYWTWSQQLDWGYYSKPPGIAWQIKLGILLFGSTELGVRFLSIVISIGQSLAVYLLAKSCRLAPSSALIAALAMAFSPIGILGSFLATTDGGLLFFWTCACLVLTQALHEEKMPQPWLMGACLLAGALFKWTIYLLWLPFFWVWKVHFPQLRSSHVIVGIAISLIGLLPSVWWNGSHDWATFKHISATLQGGNEKVLGGNFWEFIGAQAALISPVLFGLLIWAFYCWIRHWRMLNSSLRLCGVISLIALSCMGCAALFQKVQGNWAIWAYPTSFVIFGWGFQFLNHKFYRIIAGFGISIGLTTFMLFLPGWQTRGTLSWPPYRINPFKHNMGWPELQHALDQQGYDAEQHFLVSDKYQTTSLLSFYNTGQKRAYFLNVQGIRKNQFSYWPSLQQEQKEKHGYFVWTENAPYLKREGETKRLFYEAELRKYFEHVEFLEWIPLLHQGQEVVKGAFIFRCQSCLDRQPEDSQLY